jgi:putative SOS response-associated peptidase YedK
VCTLYANQKARDAIRALFRISDNRAAAVTPRDAVLPSEMAPVVRISGDGERELVDLSWGFVRREPGRAPRRVVNTRDDQARTNPFWRASFEARRCLVPATSYAEPQGVRPATWHWFAIDARRPLFAFPGIWRSFKGSLKKDGPVVELDVYTIMTTQPNELAAAVNHERMPVLLTNESDFDIWLHGTPEQAFDLCHPYPANAMHRVGAGLERRDAATGQNSPAQGTLTL